MPLATLLARVFGAAGGLRDLTRRAGPATPINDISQSTRSTPSAFSMLRWKGTLPWEEREHGTSKQKYMVVSETDNREYLPTVWKGTVPSDGTWGDHTHTEPGNRLLPEAI